MKLESSWNVGLKVRGEGDKERKKKHPANRCENWNGCPRKERLCCQILNSLFKKCVDVLCINFDCTKLSLYKLLQSFDLAINRYLQILPVFKFF